MRCAGQTVTLRPSQYSSFLVKLFGMHQYIDQYIDNLSKGYRTYRIQHVDPRVKKGRKSVYGITRKLQKKTVFALVSQTDEKNLYAKISLKNIENDSDNFETVTNELEYCYIIQEVKVT